MPCKNCGHLETVKGRRICDACRRLEFKAYKVRRIINQTTRTCRTCGTTRSVNEYHLTRTAISRDCVYCLGDRVDEKAEAAIRAELEAVRRAADRAERRGPNDLGGQPENVVVVGLNLLARLRERRRGVLAAEEYARQVLAAMPPDDERRKHVARIERAARLNLVNVDALERMAREVLSDGRMVHGS